MMSPIRPGLPDYLAPGLSILFVGINPGLRSSEVGHHYAGHSNRFWKLLFDAGLVPDRMTCQDDWRLLDYGYGLTNLIAKPTAGIQDLVKQDFLQGRQTLVRKIKKYQPAIVAVLGVSVARVLFPFMLSKVSGKGLAGFSVQTGLLPVALAGVRVFVLPNPSGRNAHYSYQKMKDLFNQLKSVSRQTSLPVMN
ncbi:MAG: mismatch-specific DNA-glycosylase [Nitrospirota bacterium]|nr:MAG: mismatch-specific DNA-glycosylase [Nitrospirota bacterium]